MRIMLLKRCEEKRLSHSCLLLLLRRRRLFLLLLPRRLLLLLVWQPKPHRALRCLM